MSKTPLTDEREDAVNAEVRLTQDETLAEPKAWSFARLMEILAAEESKSSKHHRERAQWLEEQYLDLIDAANCAIDAMEQSEGTAFDSFAWKRLTETLERTVQTPWGEWHYDRKGNRK